MDIIFGIVWEYDRNDFTINTCKYVDMIHP